MSAKELRRAEVLSRVKDGTWTLVQAATRLGLSYRQTRRVWKKYRRRGAKGLVHGHVGHPSNRRIPLATRTKVLSLVRRKYGGDATHERFGPTLAAEHLGEEDEIEVDPETLRRWMLTAGLWSRARQAAAHRRRRERKAHFGEFVQLDGSFEDWLEDRGPRACLMNLVDDATGVTLLRFESEETTWGAVRVLRAWIAAYGVPQALYTDWKNVYVREATEAERAAGDVPLTQFGRMCAALGIRIIAANSPQAKGRVERGHGTHQDRLIKKLRRRGIADYEAANAYLATTYLAGHNARFARTPAAPEDFHLAAPSRRQLDAVFHLEHERTLSNDWVVRYENRYFQVPRQSRYAPARATVIVREDHAGTITILYRGRVTAVTEIPGPPAPAPRPVSALATPPHVRTPAASHPWRQGYAGMPDRTPWGPPKPRGCGNVDALPTTQAAHIPTALTGTP